MKVRQSPSGKPAGFVIPPAALPGQVGVWNGENYIPTFIVLSVFGRVGAVIAAIHDYKASLIDNDSAVPGPSVSSALNALKAQIAGIQSPVLISINLPDLATTIPPTNLFPLPPPAGLLSIDLYIQTTQAAGTATAQARIDWTDDAGPTNQSITQFLGALGRSRLQLLVRTNGLANVQYRATVAGAILTAKYQLSIDVKPG